MFMALVFSLILHERCYSGIVTDCINAARLYEKEKNYVKSTEFLDAACILGDGYSCLKLSHIYIKKLWENVKDIDDITRHKIASAYSIRAHDILGEEKIYRIFCEDFKLSGGCLSIGMIYNNKGDKQKSQEFLKTAYEIASKGCNTENGDDCLILGFMYHNGVFLEKDEKKAIEIFQKSCNLKNAGGCFYLQSLYEVGKSVPKDEGKSLEYLKKACEYFEPNACYLLWKKKNNKKYLSMACELGHKPSCLELNK